MWVTTAPSCWCPWISINPGFRAPAARSEEHTSEIQSHSDLVCRLLLEKKKHRIDKLSHNYFLIRLRVTSLFIWKLNTSIRDLAQRIDDTDATNVTCVNNVTYTCNASA